VKKTVKICTKCKQEKPEEEWQPSQFKRSSGLCRMCKNELDREYRLNNLNTVREKDKKRYKKRKEDFVNTYENKICTNCGEDKKEQDYSVSEYIQISSICKICVAYSTEEYRNKNREMLRQKAKEYRDSFSEEDRSNKLEYDKLYYQNNKQEINKRHAEYVCERIKIDPIFRFRLLVSGSIRKVFKERGVSKNKSSCWAKLPYTPEELIQHIELLFEPWMNWENHGDYIFETWDDKDPLTWKWQLDHKDPHSDFPYDSLDHHNFQLAWALSNLRPYSAKQNIIDGSRRARHAEKK